MVVNLWQNDKTGTRRSTRFVRFTYVCNDGVIRSKARYIGNDETSRPAHVGLCAVEQLVTALDDAVVEQSLIDASTELCLAPDWGSFRIISHCEGHGRVFGPIVNGKGEPWSLCPRSFLTAAVADAKRSGFTFQVSFENEFYVLSNNSFMPVDGAVYAQDDALGRSAGLMAAVAKSLEAASVLPVTLHPESGPGQFEVAIMPSPPLKAAEDQVVVRSTIKDLASALGTTATFLPRPLPGHPSSGSHINLSVWKDGENITGQGENLSEVGGAFASGVLRHLPALVAITCPSVNSYDRLRPGMCSGAVQGWGRANREAAIRVPLCAGGEVNRIEYRCADATCNPFLALGAIITAGVAGIEEKLSLPPEVKKRTGKWLTEEQVIPQSLDRALHFLERDRYLRERMGHDLHGCFLATRLAEFARLKAISPTDAVRLLIERF